MIFNQQFNNPLSTGISTLVETHTNQAIDTARAMLSNDYTIFTTQLQTQRNIVTTQLNNKFTQLEKQREEDLLIFKTARETDAANLQHETTLIKQETNNLRNEQAAQNLLRAEENRAVREDTITLRHE